MCAWDAIPKAMQRPWLCETGDRRPRTNPGRHPFVEGPQAMARSVHLQQMTSLATRARSVAGSENRRGGTLLPEAAGAGHLRLVSQAVGHDSAASRAPGPLHPVKPSTGPLSLSNRRTRRVSLRATEAGHLRRTMRLTAPELALLTRTARQRVGASARSVVRLAREVECCNRSLHMRSLVCLTHP